MSEQQVQNQIYELFKRQHPRIGVEISVLNRCIDIVYSNEKEELITIEIKLKDWRRALVQALDHQLYADKSYICMPKPRRGVNEKFLSLAQEHGIGLIWFDLDDTEDISVEEFIGAKTNSFKWPPARKKIISMLYA